jgi:ParB family chromosome partitioning protein
MKFPAFEPINLKDHASSFDAVDLYLYQIEPDKNQPRKNFNENSLEELAISIKQHGVIQPILDKDIDKGRKYQIIAGERRWRAAKMAGLEKIPVIIKDYSKANSMAVALIENIQRENLNPLEEAQAIQSLLDECFMTHQQVAENLGRSRTAVTNLLRLLALTNEVKEMINSGLIEMGHARALLSLSSEQQIITAKLIIRKSLSVRETEKLVQRLNKPNKEEAITIPWEFEKKVKAWSAAKSKNIPVKMNMQISEDGKGRVIIHCDSIDEIEWLMDNLCFNQLEEIE